MRTTETWIPVAGFVGLYSVSNLGRVLSHRGGGLYLKPVRRSNGYLHVQLCDGSGSKRQARIHSLVSAAFIGPRPSKCDVSHIDGNKANNNASNLRYESHRENCLRRREHGTEHIPSNAKVTAGDVARARQMRAAGLLQREIAAAIGLTQSGVSRLLSGDTWRSI